MGQEKEGSLRCDGSPGREGGGTDGLRYTSGSHVNGACLFSPGRVQMIISEEMSLIRI